MRPTGDRARETVFNWLQFEVPGSRCLDLYAGSGALGLEAASREAAQVVLVESAGLVADSLRCQLAELGADDSVRLIHGDAADFLADCTSTFDIVFVDPPFAGHCHADILERLVASRCVLDGGLIHVEAPGDLDLQMLSEQIQEIGAARLAVHRQRRFGAEQVALIRVSY